MVMITPWLIFIPLDKGMHLGMNQVVHVTWEFQDMQWKVVNLWGLLDKVATL